MPPLPEQHARILAEKLHDGQLALFVGSGISHLSKPRDGSDRRLPLWRALAERVAAACHERVESYPSILDLFDAIELDRDRFRLEQAVREILDDREFELSDAHEALKVLPWASIITTNYDNLLGRLLEEEAVHDERDYDRLSLPAERRPRLFHLHGTLESPHTLTHADYRRWEEKHPRAYRHLEQTILDGTVLFIGYSLTDPHLDAVLETVRKITKGREKRVYAWMWELNESHAKLLDRRDKIEAVSIRSEEDWGAAFRQVGAVLDERKRSRHTVAPICAPDDRAYDRQQYLAAIQARYGVANLQGLYISGAGYARGDVQLAEVFVEPDLEVGGVSVPIEIQEDASSLKRARRLRTDSPEERGQSRSRRLRAGQVVAREPRLLVIGAPGQGKSTLLRHILLAQARIWHEQLSGNPFPVLVRLSDWALEEGPIEGRLISYIKKHVVSLGEIGSSAVELWLKGPVLWLLDGIDEIRERHLRAGFIEDLNAVVNTPQRQRDRWVATARPAGEPLGGVGPAWQRAVIPAFSDWQVGEVLRRWGGVLKRKESIELDARDMARSIRKDAGLRQVRTNAFFLTLIVLFYKSRKRLPRDRWEFYCAGEQALRDAWVHHRLRNAKDYLPGDY
jgi:hypothetical protein